MNTIYKLVWNATTGSFVAASELARGRKKKSRVVGVLAVAIALGLNAGAALAADQTDTTSTITCAAGQMLADGSCVANNAKELGGVVAGAAMGAESIGTMAAGGSFNSNTNGIAIAGNGGALPTASNIFDIAIGNAATANNGTSGVGSGQKAIAIGSIVNASGAGTIAMGDSASAIATGAVAIGANASASGNNSVAFGHGANASVQNAVALGTNAVADQANTVSVGNGTTNNKIVNMANGVNANDAVNVSQLSPALAALGTTLNADGSVTAPSFNVGGTTYSTIADAFTDVDGRVTQNSTDIGTLNTTVNGLSTSVTNLDGRVTTNETNINQLQSDISNGAVGLVKQDAAGLITVAGASGGNLVDFTGTDGLRRITGVENGVSDDDVVTMSQLKAAGLYDPSGDPMTVISYDDHSLASATLGGSNGTLLNNVAAGGIFAGSMQAVNGGQLFDMQEAFNSQFASLSNQYSNLDGRVGTIEQGIADGSIGGGGGGGAPGYGPNPGSGDNSVVIGDGANASGSDSTAVGNGANASGDSSTAIGNGSVASGSNSTATGANAQATGTNSTANGANAVASGSGSTAVGESASATGSNSTALGSNSSATGNNSVALGAGSVADRDNTVSVGAPGQERQITNVAAGTQRTDAANWGQVQDAVNGVRDWADQKFHQVDKRINRMGAMSAAYGQMAFSAQGLETKNRLGVGVGTQGGQSAIALGYSRQLQPNMNLSFGGSASSGDVSVGAGMSFGW